MYAGWRSSLATGRAAWKATIGLLPALAAVIAMIIFIKYPLNDQLFKQIRDETEARKLAVIKAHDEDPKTVLTPSHPV
jgi:Na+/melibiose symporter-like transporter